MCRCCRSSSSHHWRCCCCCCCWCCANGRWCPRSKEDGSRLGSQRMAKSHAPVQGNRGRRRCYGCGCLSVLPVGSIPRNPCSAAKGIGSRRRRRIRRRTIQGQRHAIAGIRGRGNVTVVQTAAAACSGVSVFLLQADIGRTGVEAVRLVFGIDRQTGTPGA